MKKLLLSLLLVLMAFSPICAAAKKSLDPIEIELPSLEGEQFNYAIDPRLEVMGVICRLAEYQAFSLNYNGDNTFLSQIDTIFEKYKDHKTVKAVKNYKNKKNIDADAWVNFAYHLKPDFSGAIVDFKPFPKDLYPGLKTLTEKQLNEMVSLVHDFVVDTNFQRICILNQGSYVRDVSWLKEDIEKFDIRTWADEFFCEPEIKDVTIITSRLCAGSTYYDYVRGSDDIRQHKVTVYPGISLADGVQTYTALYTQDYATRNWDIVKDNVTKYLKDLRIKLNPEAEKEIEKEEIYDSNLCFLLTNYCLASYISYKAEKQTEEDISKYGDFAMFYDTWVQTMEKSYGSDATRAFQLLEEYSNNRDTYPNFRSFESKINEFINTLKID